MRTGEIALERTDAGLAVVTITGEHDLSTAPSLGRQLNGLLQDADAIVVDLSPATFLDSSILGVLIEASKRASEANVGFAVAHGNGAAPAVGRILDVTGLRTELPVHGDRGDAASAASKKGKGA